MNEKISQITIVGGGTAGWMTATALSAVLDLQKYTITLIESDAIGTVGVGEATVPPILQFNQLAKIDEREFLQATNGTFKLGIEFVDWYKKGKRYLHPFGVFGAQLGPLAFHEYWQKAWINGDAKSIEHYSLICQAAKEGRFEHPAPDGNSILAQMGYAYHFDAGLYAKYLRKLCEARGVKRIEGKIESVQCQQDGFIKSISLDTGQSIVGELFIDCSGFRALLLTQALNINYTDWSHWLPCNRAIAVPTKNIEAPIPYTRATAHQAGWQWRIPLQHRVGNGHVYAADFISQQNAEETLLYNLDSPTQGEPRHLQFCAGVREKIWHKNCVAIGLSAGFLEPLESTSIHLIQRGIALLLENFPNSHFDDVLINRYNRKVISEYTQTRDFIIMHYKLTNREDSEFWRYVKQMSIPDSLQEKLELYANSGRIYREDNCFFNVTSWMAVMHGQGLVAKDYPPVVDSYPYAKLKKELEEIEHVILDGKGKMHKHEEYLNKYIATMGQTKKNKM